MAVICPVCHAEYRPGFYRCADCDVALVADPREAIRFQGPPPDRIFIHPDDEASAREILAQVVEGASPAEG